MVVLFCTNWAVFDGFVASFYCLAEFPTFCALGGRGSGPHDLRSVWSGV